jgi:aminoglycoside phosphotransferase (APT) family kinase protein
MDRLVEWLPANLPADEGEARVIHGDYRCDNMIFHPVEPRVLAVLDWELSTLGHPLADFSYHLMMYRMPAGITAGLAGLDLAALNIPSEVDYVAAYCRRTGRSGIPDLDFYVAVQHVPSVRDPARDPWPGCAGNRGFGPCRRGIGRPGGPG